MKKKILLAFAAFATIATATACGSKNNGSGDITIDDSGEIVFKNVNITFNNVITGTDNVYLTNLVKQFNEEYKGRIRVSASAVQPADLYDNLPTSTTSKRNADVALVHAERVLQFAAQKGKDGTSKYFRELEDIMKLSKIELNSADFPEQVWNNMRYDNHQYGIPFDLHMAGIYVNTTMLKKLGLEMPKNRADLVKCAQAAVKAGHYGLPLTKGFPDTYAYINGYFNHGGKQILVEGDEGFDPNQKLSDGTVVPAQPGVYYKNATLNAVKSYGDLIFKDKVCEPQLATDTNLNEFYNGNSLFCLDGVWVLSDMEARSAKKNFEFSVIPASTMYDDAANKEFTGDVYTNGHIFVMPKNNMGGEKDSRKQASMEFIKWMLNHSTDWAKSGKIAAYAPARATDEYKAIKHLDEFGAIEKFRCIQANKYTFSAFSPSQQVNTFVLQSKIMPTDEEIKEQIAKFYEEGIALVKQDISGGAK